MWDVRCIYKLGSNILVLVSKTPVKGGEPFQLLQGLSIAKVGKVWCKMQDNRCEMQDAR